MTVEADPPPRGGRTGLDDLPAPGIDPIDPPRWSRILLKLSGEAFAGDAGFGIDGEVVVAMPAGTICNAQSKPNSGSGTNVGWKPIASTRNGTEAPQPSNAVTVISSVQFAWSRSVSRNDGNAATAQKPVKAALQLCPTAWLVTLVNRHCAGMAAASASAQDVVKRIGRMLVRRVVGVGT